MANLDADVGQIIKNLFSKKKGGNTGAGAGGNKSSSFSMVHYKQAAAKCIMISCGTIVFSWCINHFTEASTKRADSEFQTLAQLEEAVIKIEQDTATGSSLLEKNKKKVEEILPLFSDMEGSKTLFKLISNLAAENNLVIKNLTLGKTTEINNPALHTQNEILLEIEGFYPNYLRFKRALSKEKPIIRVQAELVKLLLTKEGDRKIEISLSFNDYSITKGEYEEILQK